MRFFMYSECGEGAQILARIEEEGNDCAIFINDKIYRKAFDGLLIKTHRLDDFIDKDTVMIFDMGGNGKIADSYKRRGHLVYGGSEFADKLEHDREYGFEMMRRAGIKLPEYKEFAKFSEGIKYIEESNKRLVFKPNGDMPCKLTYCSCEDDPIHELIQYMKFVEKEFGKDIDSFILQDFVEGVVVSTEFFCTPDGFIRPANHTVEVKKAMNDELGPSTGCAGNIAWCCEDDRIVVEGVAKIESLCKTEKYVGQIDLNSVANEEGVFGLEWTPRFGYEATPTLLSGFNGEIGKFFSDVVRGQAKEVPITKGWNAGIRLSIPPYPVEPQKGIETEDISPNIGVPIQNWEDHGDCIYFYEVNVDDDEQLQHSGGTGVIACAMGYSEDDAASAVNDAKEILDDIILPDKQYRTDLDKVLPKMIEEVEKYA